MSPLMMHTIKLPSISHKVRVFFLYLFFSISPTYLDCNRYFGNFWCESQTKEHASINSRSHNHYKRVFVSFYQKCWYPARGYRGWQRSRSLPNQWRKAPAIHSARICLRVRTYPYLLISLSTRGVLYPHVAAFLDGVSSLA
jgi:hypothetical protein